MKRFLELISCLGVGASVWWLINNWGGIYPNLKTNLVIRVKEGKIEVEKEEKTC